jgi:hypothetical protein
MNLQDKMTDHILTFHRKLRVASIETPNPYVGSQAWMQDKG